MTRWMQPPLLERQGAHWPFDPVVEGTRYRLPPDLLLAIWERVRADETDSAGRHSEEAARRRFHELAVRIAARGPRSEIAKRTRVGVELFGDAPAERDLDLLEPRVPGRDTLVLVEALRTAAGEPQAVEPPAREAAKTSPAAHARLDYPDCCARGVTELLQRLGPEHGLRQEMIAAIAGSARWVFGPARALQPSQALANDAAGEPAREPQPGPALSNGQALWRAAERRGAMLYRRAVSSTVDLRDPAVESAVRRRGDGQPLPAVLAGDMERELGISLAGVRLHTDAVASQAARALGAEAFTLGEDIFFADGAFAPDTPAGHSLLAHELTHVAQALQGAPTAIADGRRVSQPGDPQEREADAVAERVTRAASPAGIATQTQHEPLEPSVQARMARLFGVDFGDVKVHARSSVVSGTTRARTRGREIHFGDGEYRPGTPDGDRVIAHELAHVVQLRGGGRPGATHELEAEADRAAWRVAEGQPAAIELGAPRTGEYNYTDAAGNTIPDPIEVTWSSDPFHLEFKRDDSSSSPRLVCTLRYLGPHAIDGPGVSDPKAKTIELWRYIGTGPLKASVRKQTATAFEIDLYGDGTQIMRIADEAGVDGAGATKGRKHALEMTLNRASGSYVTVWVRDPSAKASDVTPAPAEERPGTNPQVWYTNADREWTVRIDGDGDQYKELELRFKNVTPGSTGVASAARRVQLKVTQLSTNTTVQNEFDLPQASELSQPGLPVGGLFPVVKQVSDGGSPTIIDLAATISSTPPRLLVQPPERTATQTKYKVQAPGGDIYLAFPVSTSRAVFGAGTAGVVGNIVNVDLTLGAYQDKFRLTIQPRGATGAVLGLSQLYRGQPTGGLGAELHLAGPIRFTQLLTGDTSFGLDLDGDKRPDLMLYDRLTTPDSSDGGGPPENNRNHQVRIVGAAIGGEQTFTFRIRAGVPMREGGAAGSNGIAVSNALAVGALEKQRAEGTSYDDQLDAYEATMMAARNQAVPALLSKPTFDAWKALSESMIKLKPQKSVDTALQTTAAAQADAFYKLISDETTAKATTKYYSHGAWQTTNPYAASTEDNVKTTGAGPELGKHIRAGMWGTAFSEYQTVVSGLDRWIVDRTKATKGAHSSEAQQLELIAGRRRELAALDGLGAQPVLAVFQPDEKFKNEQGFVSQVPLSLYYWKTGNKWYLRNLSNPDKTYHVSTEAKPDEGASLRELVGKLDDPDRLPAGRIHYDIPGKASGEVRTTDGLTWQKGVTYLGLALAAAGFTLATFGTGGWAVAGAWVMAGSALAGGVAAGIDLGDKLKHGDLDATSAVLDIAQMVGGLAGASALASGRITMAAANAPVNARWAGPWARLAVLSSKIYLPATRIGAVADVISFGVITEDMAKQLDAIEARSGDDPSAKGRAKLRLLIQFATLGTMTSLSVKGALPGWSRSRTLVLHPGPDGIPLATLALDANTAVIDTQLAIALEKQAKGLPLQEGEKAMIARAKSLGDLRVTDKTAAEMAVKGGNSPQKGVPISVERTSQVYQDMLVELAKEPPVGRTKGVADREIVADAFFGVTEPGVTPRLAAHDPGVYNPLARRAGIVPEKLGASVPDKFPGGFDVTVNGRTIKVLPISKTLPTK